MNIREHIIRTYFDHLWYASIFLLQVTSEEVVLAYIERIKEVNPIINAVVEDRFEAAIEDAKRADRLIATTTEFQLITNYPIIGVPFTVKESCSLKGKYSPVPYNREKSYSLSVSLGNDLCEKYIDQFTPFR